MPSKHSMAAAGTTISAALQSVVKYFKITKSSSRDDVALSQVQYKFMFGALLTCASLSGLKSWYSTIDCAVSEANLVDKKYVEDWCYANSTFLVKDAQNGFVMGNQYSSTAEGVFYLGYYQWVTIAILLQAACFQIPRLLWKFLEGGRLGKIVGKLPNIDVNTEDYLTQVKNAAKTFVEVGRRNYFKYFALSQSLYFVNALLQICFTQTFLYNEFLNLLPAFLLGNSSWNRVFPKLVKCNFVVGASTGAPQTMNVVCVLAMNTLFEKLYLFIWILLAVALLAAIAQNVLVFNYIIAPSSLEANGKDSRNLSDELLLKFLKMSLNKTLYDALKNQIEKKKKIVEV